MDLRLEDNDGLNVVRGITGSRENKKGKKPRYKSKSN